MIELLIAATMMSVLVVGLASHLRGGIAVWQRTTETAEILQRRSVALERLERDLANAIVYDSRPDSYGTDAGTLPIPAFEPDGMAWFTIAPTAQRRSAAVRRVTYRCEEHDGTMGLWRTSQSVGQARAHRQPVQELILQGCRGLTLQYAYLPAADDEPLEWHSEWKEAHARLPRLIEAAIQLDAGTELRRILAIPIGVLTTFEPQPPS